MTQDEIKALAEQFRAIAPDPVRVAKLADDTRAAHPTDTEVGDLCNRFKTAGSGGLVIDICDEIRDGKASHQPHHTSVPAHTTPTPPTPPPSKPQQTTTSNPAPTPLTQPKKGSSGGGHGPHTPHTP